MLLNIPGGPDKLARAVEYLSGTPDVRVQVESEYGRRRSGGAEKAGKREPDGRGGECVMAEYIARFFSEKKMADAWVLIQEDFFQATLSTLYITLMSTLFAILIGLPLGIILVTGDSKGIRPLPRWLMTFLNWVINLLRSAPFIILIVLLMPFTRMLLGSAVGDAGVIVPLVIAAFPFVARLVEGSLRELNPNIIEMAQSSGANTWQTVFHVMLPESVPSLITSLYHRHHHHPGLYGHERRRGRRRPGKPGHRPGAAAVQPRGAAGGAGDSGHPGSDSADLRNLAGQKERQAAEEPVIS